MPTGTVRSYNNSKGFGLITPDLGGPPLFVRKADIRSSSAAGLKVLQRVRYELHESSEGNYACGVSLVAS